MGHVLSWRVDRRAHRRDSFFVENKKPFWKIVDLFIVTAPIGLGLGRIGNFINGELYGRVTQVPGNGLSKRRPPSSTSFQLYESALEGGVLFSFSGF